MLFYVQIVLNGHITVRDNLENLSHMREKMFSRICERKFYTADFDNASDVARNRNLGLFTNFHPHLREKILKVNCAFGESFPHSETFMAE